MAAIGAFGRDLKQAWRALGRSPGFLAAAVLTLALGIGATTAIFSVVKAILLEPLPFRDPASLVFVWSDMTSAGYPRGPLSGPELRDLRERTTRFDGFGAVWATTTTITGDGDPEMLRIGLVTADFFPLLGVVPPVGRLLTEQDEAGILLSDALWRRRFGRDPAIVGRRLQIDGQPATVVGVMPAGFKLLLPPDAGVPDGLEAWRLFNRGVVEGERGRMFLRVVGRLRPGATLPVARLEVEALAGRLSGEYADYGRAGRRFALVGLQEDGVRPLRGTLLALFGGVAILLLTAVVNVAGLLMARAVSRSKETALVIALGASRGRLFSRCLAEGTVVSTLGGLAGLLTALLGVRLLVAWRPAGLARIDGATVDVPVLAAAAATAIAVALVCSLAPMTEMLRTRLASTLRQGTPGSTGSMSHRARAALVVAQLALSVVLVVGAALFARSFRSLLEVDPGFRTDGVVSFRVALAPDRFYDQDAFNAFSRQWQEKLAALPGVAGVGAISHLPFDNVPNWSTTWLVEQGADDSEARRADARAVSPGYFATVGARLTRGRDFTEADGPKAAPVVIVDESFARRAWPDADPVGQAVAVDPFVTGHARIRATVVGVVGHIRHLSLLEEVREQVYFPVRQVPRNPLAYVIRLAGAGVAAGAESGTGARSGTAAGSGTIAESKSAAEERNGTGAGMAAGGGTRATVASRDPAIETGLATRLRAALDEIDPLVPIVELRPLADAVVGARGTQRFTMRLALLFAAVALGIGSVGVYGVMAYAVARRRAEFGVRLALGARPGAVMALVVRQGTFLAAIGLFLGAVAALGVTGLVGNQLYGIRSTDPISYLIAVPVLAVAAVLASWLPARRATRVNPLEALRSE